jgi:uncharacterized protein (DUF924 family)
MVPQGCRVRCRDPRTLRRGCRSGLEHSDTRHRIGRGAAGAHPAARPIHPQHFPRYAARLCRRRASLRLAETLVAAGRDKNLSPWQRWFAYLPFEHSETELDQERCAALFAGLRREMRHEAFDSAYDYALRHREVIARFGRFPHRNAILGRKSTTEEIEFLKQPGSSF